MLTKNLRLLFVLAGCFFASCHSAPDSTTPVTTAGSSDFHKITVQEVLQASAYTYLHSKQDGNDVWLAVPSMEAKAGDTYYYEGGIQMTKFESKELKRVFESIILLEKLNTEPKSTAVVASSKPSSYTGADNTAPATMEGAPATGENYKRTATPPEKKAIKVTAAAGGITIGELFGKKDNYSGKTVKIKGQVVKFTPAVMHKNWIHIQDGTESGGKFDLAITTDAEVQVGDEVTFEGKIGLNKDLGYGYFFDVLMEDAKLNSK